MADDDFTLVHRKIFVSGVFAVIVGGLIYLLLYPVKFHYGYKVIVDNPFYLQMIYSVTSLLHVFFMTAFSVVTNKVITKNVIITWSIFWASIDTIFEVSQASVTVKSLTENNAVGWYLNEGTFDKYDVVAIWLGCSLAIILLVRLQKRVKK